MKTHTNLITPPKQPPNLSLHPTLNTLQPFHPLRRLFKRNTQTLGPHTRSSIVFRLPLRQLPFPTTVFNIIFTLRLVTPGDEDEVFGVEGGDNVFPVVEFDDVRIVVLFGTGEHVVLDCFEESGDGGCEGREGEGLFCSRVATDGDVLSFCNVLGTDFNANGDALQTSILRNRYGG